MASTGNASILPSYQRFVNGVPVPSIRRSFRSREKCLILLVLLTFGGVCFGAFFYLPEYGKSNSNRANDINNVLAGTSMYKKVYERVQKAGEELLIPAPPVEDSKGIRHHWDDSETDPHVEEDRAKLRARIEEDSNRVLPRPQLGPSDDGRGPRSSSSPNPPALLVPSKPAAVPAPPARAPSESDLNVVPDVVGGGGEFELAIITIPPDRSDRLPVTQGGDDSDDTTRTRRAKIKEMLRHAWDNYVRFAWGKNELRPISRRGHSASIFGASSLGATIVDGLDTLYIMGLTEEFRQGRDWIAQNMDLDQISTDLSVFETNIRFVGGLLACFALTGDVMFRDKAVHVADKLLPAFDTHTGIPLALVNSKTGVSKNYGWASGGCSILSEFGTLHLEFSYLSDITGDPKYRAKVDHIRDFLNKMEKPKGLYPNYLNPKTGKWGQYHMSLGALGDSFYEYLLKAWLQSGRTDGEARQMFDAAMQPVITHMVRNSRSGLVYVSDLKFDRLEHKMDHLACFAGGLFGLASRTLNNNLSMKYMDIAEGLTNTCHESYIRTTTGLGPESFRFTDAIEAKALKGSEKYYILRPETIESYFIMWRLTKNQKYRDWGWEAVQALEKHCRVEWGYSGIKNVYSDDPQKDDVQQSFFLAETLKYLYLLFSDDSLLSLDEWVYNTEAHPLPIKGANPLYRATTTPIVIESA